MPPLSIVHLTTFLQGGAGRAIVDLACAQRRAGHEVLVMTSATGEDWYGNYPHYLDRLRVDGVTLVLEDSLFKRDEALNTRALERLRAARAADAVDIVHAHAATPARIGKAYSATAARKMALVQTQHGWGSNKTPEQAAADVAILQGIDGVIVTSDSTGRLLAGLGVARDRMTTIPCGLPPLPPPGLPEEAKRCLGPLRGAGRRIIGCVGSVTTNKNQILAVEALARTTDPGLTVVFLGEGGEELATRANELGVRDRVHPLGYRANAERWMPLFDLVVVPSFTEGQGLVVLEAFRAGVPVAASDIPALRELVSDGETGWLFDPHDAQSLADTIQRAIHAMTATRARVAQAARQVFLEQYTLDETIASHDALYRRLLEATRGEQADPATV